MLAGAQVWILGPDASARLRPAPTAAAATDEEAILPLEVTPRTGSTYLDEI
jgi:hypothetical protein